MKISLSPDVENLIAEHVRSGRYQSADEVVREGLELLGERQRELQSSSNDSQDIAEAFATITRGVPQTEWEKVPSDLSKDVDRYLYNGRKPS